MQAYKYPSFCQGQFITVNSLNHATILPNDVSQFSDAIPFMIEPPWTKYTRFHHTTRKAGLKASPRKPAPHGREARIPQPGKQHVAGSTLGKPVIKQCLRAAFPSRPEPGEVRANTPAHKRTTCTRRSVYRLIQHKSPRGFPAIRAHVAGPRGDVPGTLTLSSHQSGLEWKKNRNACLWTLFVYAKRRPESLAENNAECNQRTFSQWASSVKLVNR